MEASAAWFAVVAGLSTLAWSGGLYLGRHPGWANRIGLSVGLLLLSFWTWLIHHPDVAVRVIPVWLLSQIEGTGGVPIFMLILGNAWSRSRLPRQRRAVGWAAMLGAVYLFQGGLWMLQTTPSVGFAETIPTGPVRQSQKYSCVAAACATALNKIGIRTTEAEMARLTRTRPGTGSTTIRALDGLRRRLSSTAYQVELRGPTLEQLRGVPLPAVTPLQLEAIRRHMVTLLDTGPAGVWLADPVDGSIFYSWNEFAEIYSGQVLVFIGP